MDREFTPDEIEELLRQRQSLDAILQDLGIEISFTAGNAEQQQDPMEEEQLLPDDEFDQLLRELELPSRSAESPPQQQQGVFQTIQPRPSTSTWPLPTGPPSKTAPEEPSAKRIRAESPDFQPIQPQRSTSTGPPSERTAAEE